MKKFLAQFSALAVLLAGVAVLPADRVDAAAITSLSDTMSRIASGATAVTHSVKFTIPAALSNGATIKIAPSITGSGFFNLSGSTIWVGSGVWAGTGSPITQGVYQASVVGQTMAYGNGSGVVALANGSTFSRAGATLVMTGFNALPNPNSTGSFAFTVSIDRTGDGTYDDAGSYAVVISNGTASTSDQVVVTATVDPTITFTVSGSSVSMGSLDPVGGLTTGATVTQLLGSSNASNGLVITAQGARGGLYSATANGGAGYTMSGSVNDGSNQTDGFALYVGNGGSSVTGGGSWQVVADAATGTASGYSAVSSSPKSIFAVTAGPFSVDAVVNYVAEIASVAGGNEGITPAASDYTETITYVATGTF